jgi:hypothetical protein
MSNNKKMDKDRVEVARSYSRTVQLEPFTPTNVFMSAKASLDSNDIPNSKIISNELYDLCKKTVDNDIEKLIIEKEKSKRIAKELS